MENTTSQKENNLINLGDARIQKLIGQAHSTNGYEREAAVIEIKRLAAPQLLPTLIRRANDWVPNISAHASDALISLLKTENRAFFLEVFPDILHLVKCGRRDHSHLVNSVIEFFLYAAQRASLVDAIDHKNPKVNAIAFRLCKERNLVPQRDLLLMAIKSNNIAVVRGAAYLINEIEDNEFVAIASQLIRHKCNAIASRAIKRLHLIAPQEVAKISVELIFSSDAHIRTIARDNLCSKGTDALKIYRDSLYDLNMPLHKRKVALKGIYEMQHDHAIEDLKQASAHNEPSIRALAIPLLVEVMGDDGRRIAIDGILDDSSTVVKASSGIFVKQGFQLSVDELLSLEKTGTAPNLFNVVLFLARKGNKWNHILLLLELSIFKPDRVIALQSAIGQWESKFNQSYSQPTIKQVQRLKELHSKSEKILGKSRWQNLKFIMDTLDF
jgi:hypothetical protein